MSGMSLLDFFYLVPLFRWVGEGEDQNAGLHTSPLVYDVKLLMRHV